MSIVDRLNNTSFLDSKAKKRHLLSLNGLKLTKHLQTARNENLNSKKNITTDLSIWVGNDQEKMEKLLNTMTQQSFNLKLNDKTLKNRMTAFDLPGYNRMNGINGQLKVS